MGRLLLGCQAFASLGHAEALGWKVGRTRVNCHPHDVDEKTEEQRGVFKTWLASVCTQVPGSEPTALEWVRRLGPAPPLAPCPFRHPAPPLNPDA